MLLLQVQWMKKLGRCQQHWWSGRLEVCCLQSVLWTLLLSWFVLIRQTLSAIIFEFTLTPLNQCPRVYSHRNAFSTFHKHLCIMIKVSVASASYRWNYVIV